jgi:class 3 adenylate cyclase
VIPETQFAVNSNDGVNIAYQVVGDGPNDMIVILGLWSNLDILWEEPRVARFFLELARLARVIIIDRRGTGLSDRVTPPTFEEQMDDIIAVMDAAESAKACFLGYSEGGCMCALFAATYPERTASLVTIGSYARWSNADDYSLGTDRGVIEKWFATMEKEWGGPVSIEMTTPTLAKDEKYRRWLAKFYRSSANRADAIALLQTALKMDLRAILPAITVPTLVLQSTGDLTTPFPAGRDFAERILNARFVAMDSIDHTPWASCSGQVIHEVQKFLGGKGKPMIIDRVLTTVLFTDIVDSTQRASDIGDLAWSDLLAGHHQAVRRELEIFRGNEVKTTGDGFHATFDGPARAIQCAVAIRESTRQLGLNVRIGIHTGECEIRGESLEGVAIHMAARVSGIAAGGDILVSRTVKDLVAGSGIEFDDFGTHSLKGIPEEHQIFKVTSA